MKKFLGSIVPFFLFHLVCCGGLLIFLTTTGYLLIIREEGRNKAFFLPLLAVGGFFFLLYSLHGKHCEKKGHKTLGDYSMSIFFYIGFSIIFGALLMIYIFIPWWIPNYKGGFLLP